MATQNYTESANKYSLDYADRLIDILGDSRYLIPSIQLADYHARKSESVFTYSYAYHIESSRLES